MRFLCSSQWFVLWLGDWRIYHLSINFELVFAHSLLLSRSKIVIIWREINSPSNLDWLLILRHISSLSYCSVLNHLLLSICRSSCINIDSTSSRPVVIPMGFSLSTPCIISSYLLIIFSISLKRRYVSVVLLHIVLNI